MLSQVHASTDQEIREMHDEQANPQNAVVREPGWGVEGGILPQDWEFVDSLFKKKKIRRNIIIIKERNGNILVKNHIEKESKL